MATMQKRNMLSPDETRTFDKGKLELVTIGGLPLVAPPCSRGGAGPPRSNRWQKLKAVKLLIFNITSEVVFTW